jgi:hypothetical protein
VGKLKEKGHYYDLGIDDWNGSEKIGWKGANRIHVA